VTPNVYATMHALDLAAGWLDDDEVDFGDNVMDDSDAADDGRVSETSSFAFECVGCTPNDDGDGDGGEDVIVNGDARSSHSKY
jgi:hypothetical protein